MTFSQVNIDGKFYRKGDIFFSLRHQSMVILYRPSENEILWTSSGKHFFQHDVDIISDSKIVIFNNNVKNFYFGPAVQGNNEVLIYDFEKDLYEPYMAQSMKKENIRTLTGGLQEILNNNDLFIEESDFGRFLYFNSDGTLRWQYVNRWQDKIYRVAWSRVYDRKDDIKKINYFLNTKLNCQ